MDQVRRTLLVIALLSVAGLTGWTLVFGLDWPVQAGALAIVATSLVAAWLVLHGRLAGAALALLAGGGGLLVASGLFFLLGLSGVDTTLLTLTFVPGGATVILAMIDVVAHVLERRQPGP